MSSGIIGLRKFCPLNARNIAPVDNKNIKTDFNKTLTPFVKLLYAIKQDLYKN